jgi:hypothetical protein
MGFFRSVVTSLLFLKECHNPLPTPAFPPTRFPEKTAYAPNPQLNKHNLPLKPRDDTNNEALGRAGFEEGKVRHAFT